MPFVSARYQPVDPLMPPDAPKPVQATDEQGQVWALTEDSQYGDWVRYLEDGGTIDPAEPNVNQQITSAPEGLFGGPTLGKVYGV